MGFVGDLRKYMKLSQYEFAAMLGCSYASVQNYESGRRVPAKILERVADIAREHGFEFDQRPQPAPISLTNPQFAPTHTRWHVMLETILEGGNLLAIKVIQSNLAAFSEYIDESKKPHKKTNTA